MEKKPSEKEEEYMVTNKATINRNDSKDSLILNVNNQALEIILTEDNPNNVKAVFNSLLKELKKGFFIFELDDSSEDLYYNICKEYVTQLNTDLKSVYDELSDYELLEE